MLITQLKLVNKIKSKTSNDSLVPAVPYNSGQLKKVNVSFSQFKRTTTKKLMDREDELSNYVNAELKVDETFIIYNGIARKRKKL